MDFSQSTSSLTSHVAPRRAWNTAIERILVPLDGSRLAECSLPHAIALAKTFDAELILLRVLEHDDSRSREGGSRVDSAVWRINLAEMHAYLASTAAEIESSATRVSTRLAEGCSARAILETASESRCDLIVLSSHGHGGLAPFQLGSTAQKVLEAAVPSVFVVRARYETPEQAWNEKIYSRIVVAVDGSPRSDWALCLARGLPAAVDGELIVLQVVPIPELARHFPMDETEARLRQEMIERNRQAALENLTAARNRLGEMRNIVRTRVEVSENVAQAIESVCDEENASLVVLNAHGSGCGSNSRRYGGVADALLHYGRYPTLVFQDLAVPRSESTEIALSLRA